MSEPTAKPANTPYRWYISGYGVYFAAMGIQSVLYPWLLANVLNEPADRIGLAQMLAMLPMLLFVLVGGAVADRVEPARHLTRLHLVLALQPVLLLAVVLSGNLGYGWLIALSLYSATVGAFIIPARDSMLPKVADDIGRGVQTATATQFGSQIVGLALGGTASFFAILIAGTSENALGAAPLLVVQAGLVVASAVTAARLPTVRPAPETSAAATAAAAGTRALDTIRDGLHEVMRSDLIRPVVTLMFVTGTLFTGVFMVLLPVLVRDTYGGGSVELAALYVCFMGGTVFSNLIVLRFAAVKRQGRMLMVASTAGAFILAGIVFEPPLMALYPLGFAWGMSGGISMAMSRTIVQTAAPDTHRARILSVYQLGFMGGAPLGSLMMGFVIEALGPTDAVLVPCVGMVLIMVTAFFVTGVWRITLDAERRPEREGAPNLV